MDSHYKNILIVSDNEMLTRRFKSWWEGKSKYHQIKTSFTRTASGKPGAGAVVDLTKTEDVARIIHDFDLVISLNSAQVFPGKLVSSVKCINVHPG
ncbi:MAG: hypothetical protein ABJA57_13125, partial [Ginsengibacter sp.]